MTSPVQVGMHSRMYLNPVEIDRLTQGESGPVIGHLSRRADLLIEAARRQIPVGHVHGGSRGYPNLRDTLFKRIQAKAGGGVEIVVGSDHPIALIHHEGTRPHLIMPRPERLAVNPDARLVFQTSSGQVVFARRVHHPGTRPNRYLTDNLRIITA